jgi:hypothetical protein
MNDEVLVQLLTVLEVLATRVMGYHETQALLHRLRLALLPDSETAGTLPLDADTLEYEVHE